MFPEKKYFTSSVSECIKMMGIWDMDSLSDEFKYAKELTDSRGGLLAQACSNKKWLNILESYKIWIIFSKPENLLYLVKKTLVSYAQLLLSRYLA